MLKNVARRLRDFAAAPVLEAIQGLSRNPDTTTRVLEAIQGGPHGPDAATQLQLMLTYRRLADENRLPKLDEIGFKAYSQTDEDGILLFLFAVIGVTKRLCVEVCAGNGIECNSANLILNHGWHALLVDGDQANVE